MLGRPRGADRLLRRALDTLGALDPDRATEQAAARVRITRAFALLALDGRDAALAELDEVRARVGRLGEPRLAALCDVQDGAVQVWCGEWAAAVAVLGRVPLDPVLLSQAEIATTLLNRGLAHGSLLDGPHARQDLRRAIDLSAEHDLPIHRFKALHNLGCLEYALGNLPEALTLMRDADAMPVDVDRSRARLDRARVLADAGLLDQARDVLHEALRSSTSARLSLDRGEVHLDLARCAVLSGDVAEARAQTRRAATAFSSRQAWSRRDEARLVRALADVVAGQRGAAAARTVHGLPRPPRPSRPQDRLVTRIDAELALQRNDVQAARRAVDRLARGPRQPVGLVLHERSLRARTLLAEGRGAAAATVLRDAAEVLARHQGQASSLEVRAALALHGRRIRDLDVTLALERGDPLGVFDSVERWRAASQRVPLALAPTDERSRSLLAELRSTRRTIDDGRLPDDHPQRREAQRLEAEIAGRAWAIAGRCGPSSDRAVVRARELVASARSGTMVLSYFVSAGVLHLARLDGQGVRIHPLGPAGVVTDHVRTLMADLTASARAPQVPGLVEAVARALGSSLDVVAGDLRLRDTPEGARRVVVIPSATLATVPWAMVPGLRGVPVTVVPSATRWHRASVDAAPRGRVVALAGPGLATATAEVAAVRKVWGAAAEPSAAREAKAGEVLEGLEGAQVLHIAAHGRHEPQSPLFSSLAMADGPLVAHEFPRPLQAEHVVLSACDVGRARIRPGDEPLGLTAALLGLGARSVVAAMAPVRDTAAATAMVRYHGLLAAGCDAATALAQVVQEQPSAGPFCLLGADWAARPAGAQMKMAGSAKSAS